jgi:hypothetical protein
MIEPDEEVANLADDLKAKPRRKNGWMVGAPIYWLPTILLLILCITGRRPEWLLEACRSLMIGISALMCLLCILGLSVFWLKLSAREKNKKPFAWRDLVAILVLSCGSCTLGVTMGILGPSICYGSSLLVVFFVAKIME